MRAGVWWTWVRLGGSEAGRGVLLPEGRRLLLSLRAQQFNRLAGVALLCLTWGEEEFNNELKQYGTGMCDIVIVLI